ncbi:hypothetical protein K438DRAFT_1942684, partial [Mycena galopus ATCC 62051]
MVQRKNDEDTAPSASSRTGRNRLRRGNGHWIAPNLANQTRKARIARERTWKGRRLLKAKALQQRQRDCALIIKRPDDTVQVRELRAALSRALTQSQHHAVKAAFSPRPSRNQRHDEPPIGRPRSTYRAMTPETRLERFHHMILDEDYEDHPFMNPHKGTGPRAPSHSPRSSPSPNRNDAAALGSRASPLHQNRNKKASRVTHNIFGARLLDEDAERCCCLDDSIYPRGSCLVVPRRPQ